MAARLLAVLNAAIHSASTAPLPLNVRSRRVALLYQSKGADNTLPNSCRPMPCEIVCVPGSLNLALPVTGSAVTKALHALRCGLALSFVRHDLQIRKKEASNSSATRLNGLVNNKARVSTRAHRHCRSAG